MGPPTGWCLTSKPRSSNCLVRDLLAPDPLRIEAYTAEGGYVCNREGKVISGLYTWAALKKGDFTSQLRFQNFVGRLPISPHMS